MFKAILWFILHNSIHLRFPQVKSLSTEELDQWLKHSDRPAPLLLDVRSEAEYAVSHLLGAQQINPKTTDFASLSEVPPDTPIVTYCSVGYRSARLGDRLQQAGFTQVQNLRGSIFQWANEGRPVYRDGVEVQQVHPYNEQWGRLLDSSLNPKSAPTKSGLTH